MRKSQESMSVYASVFEEMMKEYENILSGTLSTMKQKGGTEAEISLKLKIFINDLAVQDGEE